MKVAIVGVSGAVGQEFLKVLEERNFPMDELFLFGSERSAGREYTFKGNKLVVKELKHNDDFKGVDIALTSAGAGTSREFASTITKHGAVMIDNSSAFRMDDDVPLVVPEVNPEDCRIRPRNIIANPNCSTIQMVVPLKPIHQKFKIKRVVVSTYQAVSGTGKKAIDELFDQTRAILNFQESKNKVYPHRIAFNCLPHIDVFLDNGYSKEEVKMVNETRKILEDDSIGITATTVRVPVFYGHSESVNVETHKPISAEEVRTLLEKEPGVVVVDDLEKNLYPLAIDAAGGDEILVGRIRKDESIPNGINMWVVADNIRKGAATNATQIAEVLAEQYL